MSRSQPSSTRILRTATLWGGIATLAIALVGAGIGYAIGGAESSLSAVVGAAIGALLMLLTAGSILVANRWFGQDLYVPIFFGIVMGVWIIKLIVFIVAMLLLQGQPWIEPVAFFLAIVASVLASLAIDAFVMLKMRLPYVEVSLPGDDDGDDEPTTGSAQKDKFDGE